MTCTCSHRPAPVFLADMQTQELNVSISTVSLTITSYLVIQGISPVIWGAFSDALGRRPIYVASFSVYIAANIALSFSPNFAVLLVFRGLQAAGSASTVSIGAHIHFLSPCPGCWGNRTNTATGQHSGNTANLASRQWRYSRHIASVRKRRLHRLLPSQ